MMESTTEVKGEAKRQIEMVISNEKGNARLRKIEIVYVKIN